MNDKTLTYNVVPVPTAILRLLGDNTFKNINPEKVEKLFHTLFFMLAYPSSKADEKLAAKKLTVLSNALKVKTAKFRNHLLNSGLPFMEINVQFTHDCLIWLQQHPHANVAFQNFIDDKVNLSELLSLTLNVAERAETTAGLNAANLLMSLGVQQPMTLDFLLNEFQRVSQPLVKDYLFDKVGLQCTIKPKNKFFSLAYNRFKIADTFYHREIVKRFDHYELVNKTLPATEKLSMQQQNKLVLTIKNAMALTNRETDTVTYMDENTLHYYQLERGISVAIYGMTSQRQLPFESYIGYTLFKNGFPCAYGGGWVFGKRALFGINIFEWFRGGESGMVLCQLLRVYRQVFDIDYFEVEPYQYGLDNPDGITSGAFWFYYKYGFCPVDKVLKKIAEREFQKITTDKNYRTPEKILLRFTESNIALILEKVNQTTIVEVTSLISRMIRKQFKGNRMQAERECVSLFLQKAQRVVNRTENSEALLEVALLCEAYKIKDDETINLLYTMAQTKPVNPYDYQSMLLKFLEKVSV